MFDKTKTTLREAVAEPARQATVIAVVALMVAVVAIIMVVNNGD